MVSAWDATNSFIIASSAITTSNLGDENDTGRAMSQLSMEGVRMLVKEEECGLRVVLLF